MMRFGITLVGPANASTQLRFGELSGKNSERPAEVWSNAALHPSVAGAIMAASVLHSRRAVEVAVFVVRAGG